MRLKILIKTEILDLKSWSANPTKMAKYTQTIRWQIADELFECVWPFVKLALKMLSNAYIIFSCLSKWALVFLNL